MNKTVTFINKTEGRDKFCKCIQYGTRFLKWYTLNQNKELSDKFEGLFNGMKNARKLFRLFKTFIEIQKIIDILGKTGGDCTQKYLNILQRICFGLFWVFDNAAVLITVKFLKGDVKWWAKNGSRFWFLALFSALVNGIRDLLINMAETQKLSSSGQQSSKDFGNLQKQKTDIYLGLIKSCADMITAGSACNFWQTAIKWAPHDGFCGAGGFTSAALTCYQLF